jgi:TrmH family RNA methyltransferase
VYLAEGVRWAEEALRFPGAVELWVASPRLGSADRGAAALARLRELSCPGFSVPDAIFEALADTRSPQGVLLVLRRSPAPSAAPPAPGLWLVAVGIQDPGNLGGLARTARALGAAGLVAWGGADPFHPRAVRASAGALLDLPVAEPGSQVEVERFLRRLDARAAVPRGGVDPRTLDWPETCALVLGGEAGGMPAALERACRARVSLPMRPGSDSLNVGAAAAALLALLLPLPSR